ncbi:hypothetical protein ESCO_006614 [Escovopsis weberi]|uniref:Cupin type-2 domain-containing protein n=1 Tax=Escovopsis weberi TaxID=150374 RepID=A0A0M8N106_ESCWE|nr:hypothetical protein ESCO_006614 [Escovopsis weberi]
MASWLPLLSDILPMILPSTTEVIRRARAPAHEPKARGGGGGGSVEHHAVVGRCDKMCASVLTTRPHSASPIRHNSEHDAIIYAVSGTCTLIVKEGFRGDLRRHRLGPGDFAFVPAWTEHQASNESDEEVVWLITQSGPRPVGAVLTDWGGDEVRAHS